MTRQPQHGEVWTTGRGTLCTFVGLHPESPKVGVWLVPGGSVTTYTIEYMTPPDPFPFKVGDVIRPRVGSHEMVWVVTDPRPNDESNFTGTVISYVNGRVRTDQIPNINKEAGWVLA